MKIIQAVQSFVYADGVGNDIVKKHSLLKELGYNCEIYSPEIDPRYAGMAKDISELVVNEDDVFILHYSGYCTFIDLVRSLHCRKILVTHNITPHRFFEEGPIKEYCKMGEKQLPELRGIFDMYLGDSQYNLDCIAKAGTIDFNDGYVLPIAVDFNGIVPVRKQKSKEDEAVLMFVGRVVQNKKVEDIIKAFDCYYREYNSNSRLYIVGNDKAVPKYTEELKKLADSCCSKDRIEFKGRVCDEELMELYSVTDAYVSMSEHEGFGIPLIEAMYMGVPVFAYDSAAVSETLGKGGVLIKSKKPEDAAKCFAQIIGNKEKTEEVLKLQIENTARFSSEAVAERLEKIIEKILEIPVVKRNTEVEQSFVQMELTRDIESKQPGGKLSFAKKLIKRLMVVSTRFQDQFYLAQKDALRCTFEYIEDCDRCIALNNDLINENDNKMRKLIESQQSLLEKLNDPEVTEK